MVLKLQLEKSLYQVMCHLKFMLNFLCYLLLMFPFCISIFCWLIPVNYLVLIEFDLAYISCQLLDAYGI
jgi:hypothetical protein